MCRYVVKFNNDINQCFDCPMCRYGLSDECSITERDVHDVKDTMPEWCPISEEAEGGER